MTDPMLDRCNTAERLAIALLRATGEIVDSGPRDASVVSTGFALALQAIGENIDRRIPLLVHRAIGQ